jgi:filamentous hemagglutinin
MDNGKTFAASHQLVPGVALTAAQMAQLTSDIVWLVSQTVTLPNGQTQHVLVPQVYVKLQQGDLAPSGAILAADRLQLQLNGDLTNQGSVAGRQLLSINANTIDNLAGRLQGGTVAAHANTDLNNQGGRIQADNSLSLSAGRDLTSASTTYSQQHGTGGNTLQQTALDRMAGLYLGQGTGPMLLAAGRNLDLSGSQLISQSSGSTVLQAGQDLTLGTVDTAQQRRITFNQNNWSAQAAQTKPAAAYPPRAISPCRPGAILPPLPPPSTAPKARSSCKPDKTSPSPAASKPSNWNGKATAAKKACSAAAAATTATRAHRPGPRAAASAATPSAPSPVATSA